MPVIVALTRAIALEKNPLGYHRERTLLLLQTSMRIMNNHKRKER